MTDVIGRRGPVARLASVLAAIALAGCGGSSSSSSTHTSKAAAASTTTTATQPAPKNAADQRVARLAVLRLTDFPAGWAESDKPSETSQSPCQAINSAKSATSARSSSHTFSENNDATQAESSVYVYAATASASRWFGEVSSSATRSCLGDALGKGLAKNVQGQGATVGEITTSSLSIEPVGDDRAAGRFAIPVKSSGGTVTVTLDLIFVRVDRGIAILTLVDTLTPFDETLAAKLTRDVVDRLGAGLKQAASS
jgi:hypothetical protein